MRPSRLIVALVVLCLVPAVAHAARTEYRALSFTEAADPGLTVTGPLDEFAAVSRARVVVPADWKRLKSKADQLRFITPGTACRYRVTFTVRSLLAAPGEAEAYAAAALPAAGRPYLLDSGRRGSTAFRVVRERSDSVVRLRALRAAVLTRRSDIAPAAKVAWSELRVTAASRPGDECHAGTYREVLGPQLGDALATARTRISFVRK